MGVPRCDRLSLRVVSSIVMAEVEGRGPLGRGIGWSRLRISSTSPSSVMMFRERM